MRRVYRRKRPIEYILPFLVLVGLGVIGVLGYQLWNNLQGAKGDVFFYVAAGKAKILQYGLTDWETGYSGTKLLLGDSVKTSQLSRGVLKFFNGTMVRLGDDTEVTVTDITKRNDIEKIGLTLTHGSIWINKMQTEGVDQSDLQVRTAHMLVADTGSVFEVESNTADVVRVMKGGVSAQILGTDADKNSLLDKIQVGVGQEMTLDAAILKAFQNHETPSVLMALSDQFKLSDWYMWNSREDSNPTDFSANNGQETQQSLTLSQQGLGVSQQNGSTQQTTLAPLTGTQQTQTNPSTSGSLSSPVITQPSPTVMTTATNKVSISGTVDPSTAKVVVSETIGGNTDEYTLSKYKSGSTSFTYNVSEALGNFKSGENIYRFYAVDASGNKSDSADVHITYNKTAVVVTDALVAPQVTSYNGSTNSTVTVGVVKVIGSVAGAQNVLVNGVALTKFQAGDKTWTYYANENGGNLVPGVNNYEVYAVDPQGVKSAVTKFTITYNKSAGVPASTGGTQATTPTSKPATTGSTQVVPPPGF